MPLNQALDIAEELRVLRESLRVKRDELAEVNARRDTLQTEIADIQAQMATKRAELRQASSDL